MIIHAPEITLQDDHAILWAKVELKTSVDHFPEYIWYRVPKQCQEHLTTQNDAFLVPMLLAGMYFGEDMEVKGNVSPRLAYHLEEYQHILAHRFRKKLKPVKIVIENIKPIERNANGVGSTFTGGVDSTFTLWSHLPQNQPVPEFRITHAIFLKGFDILPTEEQKYWHLFDRFKPELKRVGVELIPVETNLVSITHTRMPLPYFFGPLIAGAGMSLAGLFGRFYIPSSWSYRTLKKHSYSSDPLLDNLVSTEKLKIVHHGAAYERVEKVERIADWELAHNLLWVCIDSKFREDRWNCSRCEKCMRTMIPLYAMGKMSQFKTFEKPLKKDGDVLWWARKFSLRQNYVTETFPFVKRYKHRLIPWLRLAEILGVIRYEFIVLLPPFIKSWLRQFGYFVNPNEAPDSYEMPSINQIIREQYDHPSS